MSSIHGFVTKSIQRFLRIRGTNTCPDGRRRLDANGKAASRHNPHRRMRHCWKATATSKWLRCRMHWSKSQDEKMYLSHRMRSIFPRASPGFAAYVALKKEANQIRGR